MSHIIIQLDPQTALFAGGATAGDAAAGFCDLQMVAQHENDRNHNILHQCSSANDAAAFAATVLAGFEGEGTLFAAGVDLVGTAVPGTLATDEVGGAER